MFAYSGVNIRRMAQSHPPVLWEKEKAYRTLQGRFARSQAGFYDQKTI